MTSHRRSAALAAAVATAVALGATALSLPAAAAGQAPSAQKPPTELTGGTLEWGVKKSFRSYVTGIAMGTITPAGGAEQAPDNGPFTFVDGKGTYDTSTHAVHTAFAGSVAFSSEIHGFDIEIADVQVRTEGTTGAIEADVTLGGETRDDIEVAALDLASVRPGQGEDSAMVFKDIPATLTADGAEAFNGMYKEGDALDPATLSVKAGGGATGEPAPEPTESAPETGKPDPTKPPTTEPTSKPTSPATSSPAPSTSAPAGEVVDGTLSWGLKESFRRYIDAGGEIRLAGGAKKNDNGFDFPYAKVDLDSDARKLDASFGGSVRFLYEGHGIDMLFSDIKVETAGDRGTLRVDVTTPEGTQDDVAFATLDLAKASYAAKDDVVVLDKVPAVFTAAGAATFANDTTGSMYQEGDAIDPVTVALALTDGATLPGGTGGSGTGGTGGTGTTGSGSVGSGTVGGGTGSLAATGSDVPTGALLGAAGAVVVAGAGVVLATRRRRTATDAQA